MTTESHDAVGSASQLDTIIGTCSIVMTICAVLTLQRLFIILHHFVHNPAFNHMVSVVEKELMVVGFIAFILKLLMNIQGVIESSWSFALSFAELLIPVFSFCYCGFSIILVFVSLYTSKTKRRAYNQSLIDLMDKYYRFKNSWKYRFDFSFGNIQEQLEFRVVHNIFCNLYDIQRSALVFDAYAQCVFEKNMMSIAEIRVIDWCAIVGVILLNFGRSSLGIRFGSCDSSDIECNKLAQIILFTICGAGLFCITLLCALLSRTVTWKIFNRYGIYSSHDFPKYLQQRESEQSVSMAIQLREKKHDHYGPSSFPETYSFHPIKSFPGVKAYDEKDRMDEDELKKVALSWQSSHEDEHNNAFEVFLHELLDTWSFMWKRIMFQFKKYTTLRRVESFDSTHMTFDEVRHRMSIHHHHSKIWSSSDEFDLISKQSSPQKNPSEGLTLPRIDSASELMKIDKKDIENGHNPVEIQSMDINLNPKLSKQNKVPSIREMLSPKLAEKQSNVEGLLLRKNSNLMDSAYYDKSLKRRVESTAVLLSLLTDQSANGSRNMDERRVLSPGRVRRKKDNEMMDNEKETNTKVDSTLFGGNHPLEETETTQSHYISEINLPIISSVHPFSTNSSSFQPSKLMINVNNLTGNGESNGMGLSSDREKHTVVALQSVSPDNSPSHQVGRFRGASEDLEDDEENEVIAKVDIGQADFDLQLYTTPSDIVMKSHSILPKRKEHGNKIAPMDQVVISQQKNELNPSFDSKKSRKKSIEFQPDDMPRQYSSLKSMKSSLKLEIEMNRARRKSILLDSMRSFFFPPNKFQQRKSREMLRTVSFRDILKSDGMEFSSDVETNNGSTNGMESKQDQLITVTALQELHLQPISPNHNKFSISSAELRLCKTESELADLFLFSNPELYFGINRILIVGISFYFALWLANFVESINYPFWQVISVVPGVLSAIVYLYIVHQTALLKVLYAIHFDVVLIVLEQTSSLRQVIDTVRQSILERLDSMMHDKGGDIHLELYKLFSEMDYNGTYCISLDEFEILLRHLDINISKQKAKGLFYHIDLDCDNEVSFQELFMFVFPTNEISKALEVDRLRIVNRRVTLSLQKEEQDEHRKSFIDNMKQ